MVSFCGWLEPGARSSSAPDQRRAHAALSGRLGFGGRRKSGVRRMRCCERVGSRGSKRWWWLGRGASWWKRKPKSRRRELSDECSYPAQLSLAPGTDWPIKAAPFALLAVMLCYVHCICTTIDLSKHNVSYIFMFAGSSRLTALLIRERPEMSSIERNFVCASILYIYQIFVVIIQLYLTSLHTWCKTPRDQTMKLSLSRGRRK